MTEVDWFHWEVPDEDWSFIAFQLSPEASPDPSVRSDLTFAIADAVILQQGADRETYKAAARLRTLRRAQNALRKFASEIFDDELGKSNQAGKELRSAMLDGYMFSDGIHASGPLKRSKLPRDKWTYGVDLTTSLKRFEADIVDAIGDAEFQAERILGWSGEGSVPPNQAAGFRARHRLIDAAMRIYVRHRGGKFPRAQIIDGIKDGPADRYMSRVLEIRHRMLSDEPFNWRTAMGVVNDRRKIIFDAASTGGSE